MKRTRSIIAIGAGALAWAAVTACNQQTIPTPIRSFDRPSDVALVCMRYNPNDTSQATPHGVFDAMPLEMCEPVTAEANGLTNTSNPQDTLAPLGVDAPFRPFLVALVTQSARGEVALVDTARSQLIDADPYKPGFGFVPVGKLPEHIRATHDGCFAVTANTNSCDLSRVDVLDVIKSSQAAIFPNPGGMATATSNSTSRVPLTVPSSTPGGPLRTLYARPTWIELAPENDGGALPSLTGSVNAAASGQCQSQAVVAPNKPLRVTAHKAWVALPACHAVVKVRLEYDEASQLPSIEQAIRVTDTGAQEITDLSTLDCPVECAGVPSDMGPPPPAPPSDMGPTTGTTLPPPPWPATLAVDVEADVAGKAQAGRLVIGDGYGERIDIVPFDVASAALGTARSVTLDPGQSGLTSPGVRVVRVGRRSEAGKFLYAVARDGSVRVIDMDREVECETNPDPRAMVDGIDLQQAGTEADPLPINPQPQARTLGCFPLGAPGTPRRAPLATSPGIELTPGEVPVDVAFVHLDAPPGDPNAASPPPAASPGLLVGDFAWIISSAGRGVVVNIYNACPQPNAQPETQTTPPYKPVCFLDKDFVSSAIRDSLEHFGHPQQMMLDRISHRVRSGHDRFFRPQTEADTTGTARVPDHINPCTVTVPPTSPGVPDGGVVDGGSGCGSSPLLPSMLHEAYPPGALPADEAGEDRVVRFVDPDRAKNETWVMAWEGVIPGSDRALGQPYTIAVKTDPMDSKHQLYDGYLTDAAGQWCTRGILAGDKLVMRGCTVDTECDQAGGFTCVHDPGAFTDVTQGMCLRTDPKLGGKPAEQWTGDCGKMLRGQRKYRVLNAKQGAVLPNPDPNAPKTTTDFLHVAEIYEPEFFEERQRPTQPGGVGSPPTRDKGVTDICTTKADCSSVTVTPATGGNPLPTDCLDDVDGQKRCILPCKDDSGMSDGAQCGIDFQCAKSQVDGGLRCMRAPIDGVLWKTCMPEAQQYEVHAGDAFLVSGSGSGFVSSVNVRTTDQECVVPQLSSEFVRLRQWRIPMTPAQQCSGAVTTMAPLASMDPATGANSCWLGDFMSWAVHFENQIFNIALQIPVLATRPLIPPDGTAVAFTVTGGGNPLVSLLGVDVQAQQPRSVAVGPDGQTIYVVDEGKASTATGLRGQLLRLFSSSQSVDTTFVVR